MNVYGLWAVTTEDDCEGNGIRQLGVFRGYIDDIAFGLANRAGYSLTFTPLEIKDISPEDQTRDKVNIRINGFPFLVDRYKELFVNRDVFVTKGNIYKSIKLIRKSPNLVEKNAAKEIREILNQRGIDPKKVKEYL